MPAKYDSRAMVGEFPTTRRRVLIVEDDAVSCQALRALLQRWGFDSCECATVAHAFDELHRDIPPCILLDLMMPDASGLELLKSIRARGLGTRVVVTTAANDPRLMREVDELRPDMLFRKPLDVAKLKRWLVENL